MSLARAFTTRRVKATVDAANANAPQRSNTTSGRLTGGALRHKISAPVELIHTTNMLSYNAPDIRRTPSGSSTESASTAATHKSDDESDASTHTAASTPPTSPDVSPADDRPLSPEPNHLSCYFMPPGQSAASKSSDAPVIPQRAPSHTAGSKKSYELLNLNIHRQRSNSSRMSNQSTASSASSSTRFGHGSATFSARASASSTATQATDYSSLSSPSPSASLPALPQTMLFGSHRHGHGPKASASSLSLRHHTQPMAILEEKETESPVSQQPQPQKELPKEPQKEQKLPTAALSHPFGQELEQVREIAEEYGVRDKLAAVDAEEQELRSRGLFKFSAEEYLSEIHGLFASIMADARPLATVWI